MQKRNNSLKLLLFSALCLLLASCANEYKIEPYNYEAEYERVSKTKSSDMKNNKKEIDITDIAQKRSNYRYSAVGKKDPFRSYFGDMATLSKEKKIVSELQNFDITDLRLTAIIWGVTEPRVVIVAPNGKSHIVKTGSFIGKNWGKISRVLPNKIEIIETYKDPLGRKIINKLYLELPIKSVVQKTDLPVEENSTELDKKEENSEKTINNKNENLSNQ